MTMISIFNRIHSFLTNFSNRLYIILGLDFLLNGRSIEVQQIDDLKTVCLLLGPYRNLTTLTASMLYLHPQVQVLNHAGMRILGRRELDFMANYDERTFSNFCRYALWASQGGRRGSFGGSITLSHAFERDAMRQTFRERYGDRLLKERVRSLVWKESLKISNHLKMDTVDLQKILDENKMIRFVVPIRNPLDCAKSNIRTGLSSHLPEVEDSSSMEEVLEAIIREFYWTLSIEKRWPDRFFHIWEYEFNRDTLSRLSAFLELSPSTTWITDSMESIRINRRYSHPEELVDHYLTLLDRYFSDDSDLLDAFTRFIS